MDAKKQKRRKIIILIVAIVAAIITGTSVYVASRQEAIIRSFLETKTRQMSGGFYKIEIGKMRVEIFRRRLKIENIRLYPDSAVFARLHAMDSLPPMFVDIDLGAAEFRGFKMMKRRHKRMIRLEALWLEKPRIGLTRTGHEKEKTAGDSVPKSLYQLISPVVSSIDVEKIRINEAGFRYAAWGAKDTVRFRIDRFESEIRHFLIDSTAETRQNSLYCDDIRLKVYDFRHVLPEKLFAVSFDKMEIGLADSILDINGLKLTPQYDKHHFAAMDPKHANWMNLSVEHIRCLHAGYRKLLFERSIAIDSISMEGIAYANAKNRNVEQIPIAKPMIHEYVQKAPLPVNIRTIRVRRANIVYEDMPKGKAKSGSITFNKMSADFHGITNIVSRNNQYMTVNAKAYVQDEGVLHAIFKFPVDKNNDRFEITGNMGKMHPARLNAIFETFRVSIKKGMVDRIDFAIAGNGKHANLNMLFLYNDLHISILKEKNNRLVRRGLMSGIANGMILFNDNPSFDEEPRRAETTMERNMYRSSFHYFWHTLANGMIETIGLTKKRQEQLQRLKRTAMKMNIMKEE